MIVLLSYNLHAITFQNEIKNDFVYMACESKHQFKEFKKLPYFEASFIDDKRSKVIKML